MNFIVPTITADNPHIYREEIERVADFAKRIHIDFSDGQFTPSKLIKPIQSWWPDGLEVDLHVMYQKPSSELENLIALNPNLIIFHAESDDNVSGLIKSVKEVKIKAGVALLQHSSPSQHAELIKNADHVLIFGGNLGYHGGKAELENLAKVEEIRNLNPDAEMSWDGGINDENALELVNSGINVLNIGSFIQKAEVPERAYAIIKEIINA